MYDVNCEVLNHALRIVVILITRSYRTVSVEVTLFLASSPPGDLIALERSRIRKRLLESDAVTPAETRRMDREVTVN